MCYLSKGGLCSFGLCFLICMLGHVRSMLGMLCRNLAFQLGNGARLLFLRSYRALR